MATMHNPEARDAELLIDRTFNAPRELVFATWIDPRHLARWSGPTGFTSSHDYFDPTPGGAYRGCLRSPDGTEFWARGTYREVVAPERIVFTHAWEDGCGGTSQETVVTIVFTAVDGKTMMQFHQSPFDTPANRNGHKDGWSSSFETLERYLSEILGASA